MMGQPCREWGAIVENKLRFIFGLLQRAAEDLVLLPKVQYFMFRLDEGKTG